MEEKLNVAIADDNEKILCMLGDILEQDKEINIVGKAKNGEEAINIIREKQPDIMLIDLIMPKFDGLTVMDKINKDTSIKKRPSFIVMSAIGQETITDNAFAMGASYYIMKPFDNDMVINRIKSIKINNNKKIHDNRKINVNENKSEYIERNLESDVTNIIHELGVQIGRAHV